jgi:hypothetical protein
MTVARRGRFARDRRIEEDKIQSLTRTSNTRYPGLYRAAISHFAVGVSRTAPIRDDR